MEWRAVTIGFGIALVIGVLGLALPVIGQIGGGLLGGFVAGSLAGGGLSRGAWHGLLAGALGGLLLAIFVAVGTTVLGVAINEAVSGLLGGAGLLLVGAFLAALLAIDSGIAGAIDEAL